MTNLSRHLFPETVCGCCKLTSIRHPDTYYEHHHQHFPIGEWEKLWNFKWLLWSHCNWNRMLLQRHCASSVILLVMQFLFSLLLRAYGGICWITRNFVLTAYLHCASEQKLSNVIHFELMWSALFPIASMEPVLKSLGYFCYWRKIWSYDKR